MISKILKIIFVAFTLVSCNSKLEYVEDIYVEQEIPKIKLSLTVNISKRVNSEELSGLAEKIYNSYDGSEYESVFIIYMLPKMAFDNGSYASSHYNPDLEIKIYDLTDEEILKIQNNFSISDRYWFDRKILFEILKEENKYYIHQFGSDLTTEKRELVKEVKGSDTLYRFKNNEFGEYYLLNRNNDLSIYDEKGFIYKFLKE